MGCGKTTVGIATAAVLNAEGYRRTLVLSPPHLVYKWRREIQETVAGAKVWVLNGPDTLVKLIKLREELDVPPQGQEFFVLGRVRMRMGFHWKPLFARQRTRQGEVGSCPDCGQVITNLDGEPLSTIELEAEETRRKIYDMVAAEKLMLQGFHYPFPGVAHLEKDGNGYRVVPAPWSPVI